MTPIHINTLTSTKTKTKKNSIQIIKKSSPKSPKVRKVAFKSKTKRIKLKTKNHLKSKMIRLIKIRLKKIYLSRYSINSCNKGRIWLQTLRIWPPILRRLSDHRLVSLLSLRKAMSTIVVMKSRMNKIWIWMKLSNKTMTKWRTTFLTKRMKWTLMNLKYYFHIIQDSQTDSQIEGLVQIRTQRLSQGPKHRNLNQWH